MASSSALSSNRQILDAILFNLFVLGEAAKGVPAEVRSRHPGVHEYFGVDTEIVWDVVRAELPNLIEQLRIIIADEKKDQGAAE